MLLKAYFGGWLIVVTIDKISLEQTNTVENVTQSTLVALRVLVELAVVGAHLQNIVGRDAAALCFRSCDIFFQGSASTEVRNLGLRHALAFFGDKHFERSQVSLLLERLLGLLLLCLDPTLHSFDVALKPPF